MTDVIRRFKGLGAALAVLALSAGVVFAGAPRVGLIATSEPGVEAPAADADEGETSDAQDTDEDAGGADEDAEDADEGATGDTHGALVSAAAQMETPAGFRNHGAFVSCVAKMDKSVVLEGFDWATVTPESCGLTDDAKAQAKAEKAQAKAQAKAEKAQAKADKKAAHAQAKVDAGTGQGKPDKAASNAKP